MKILITGGAGYIGSVLTPYLLERGYQITVLDNLYYQQDSLLGVCNNKYFVYEKDDELEKALFITGSLSKNTKFGMKYLKTGMML